MEEGAQYDKSTGFFYGKEKNLSGEITIGVINSVVKEENASNIKSRNYDYLIADEVHHYGSNVFSKLFNVKFDHALGLSATPERENDPRGNQIIIEGLKGKIYELNHLDDPNSIPPFNIWSILVDLTDKEKEAYEENSFEIVKLNNYFRSRYGIDPDDEEFVNEIKKLADKNDPSARKLLKLWSRQAGIKYNSHKKINLIKEIVSMEKDGKIIIFNERISFSERIHSELSETEENAVLIHSKMSKQEILSSLDDFRNAEKGILIAPRLIDEGYDVPDASVAIIASFTSSARQMIQRDGRILRTSENKESATRYSLIIKDIEEAKYHEVLRKADVAGLALEGEWLFYDNGFFEEAPYFKEDFVNFERIKKHHVNQFKKWVVKSLDYYNQNIDNNSLPYIEKRLEFFSRYIDVIRELKKNYGSRWPNLTKKLEPEGEKKIIKANNGLSEGEKNELTSELRRINSRLILPDGAFNCIMRSIHNEKFEMTEEIREYLVTLTEGEKPDVWPAGVFNFIRSNVVNKL